MSENTSEPTVQPRVVEGQTSEPVVPMNYNGDVEELARVLREQVT
jgi:hypothetical protein